MHKKIIKIVVIFLAIVGMVSLVGVTLYYLLGSSFDSKISKSSSPDGAHTEILILGNGGATTGFVTMVKLDGEIVLGIDGPYTDAISTKWIDNEHLQIRISYELRGAKENIYRYMQQYGKVKIELVYLSKDENK